MKTREEMREDLAETCFAAGRDFNRALELGDCILALLGHVDDIERRIEIIGAPQLATTTLTRRDHFAMAALTGLLMRYGNYAAGHDIHRDAYSHADAMEAARNKEGAE